jgi:hypothetical protein
MIRNLGGQQIYAAIISAGRPHHVKPMEDKVGPVTWHVPYDQEADYRAAGASATDEGSNINVTFARNIALRKAFQFHLPCLQMDDDLKRVMRLPGPHQKGTWTEDPNQILALLDEWCSVVHSSPYLLGGVPPTNNHFFASGGIRTNVFCSSPLWLVKPTPLRLDTNLKTKFDYDYTLQHIREYGGVTRVEWLVCDFDFGTMAGGHVGTRNLEGEHQAVRYLQKKWGSKIVRTHPRREGEVILSAPKTERVVLT